MNQRDELVEKLISAYFDGELAADEQARAEQLVSDAEGAQQYLEELSALREGMRSLPQHGLERDFSGGVLRELELRGHICGADQTPQEEPSATCLSAAPARRLPTKRWRVAAAIAAVAASLLLAVYWNPSGRRPELAQTDLETSSSGDTSPQPRDPPIARAREGTGISDDAGEPPAVARATELNVEKHGEAGRSAGRQLARPASRIDRDSTEPLAVTAASAGQATTGHPQYLSVIEVAITPSGIDGDAFDEVLANHGIRYDRELRAEPELESALLASRFLKNVMEASTAPDMTPVEQGRSQVELVYVVATARQADATSSELLTRRHEFADVKFDVVIKPEEISVFHQLRSSAATLFADGGSSDPPTAEPMEAVAAGEELGRARRLVLEVSLASRVVGGVGAWGLISDGHLRLPLPPASPEQRVGAEPIRKRVLQDSSEYRGANVKHDILFVLHRWPEQTRD